MPRQTCPCCLAESSAEAFWARDYITHDEFGIEQCRSCGTGRTEPVPASLDRYYPTRYREYVGVVSLALRLLYWLRVTLWLSSSPVPGRALEVGCGDGSMLLELKRRGWQVLGLERSEAMAGAARSRGLDVRPTDLSDLHQAGTFDLIVLFQVLEHLSDPDVAVAKCSELLTPGGRIIIGVPNFSSWQAKLFKGDWFHLDAPRHLFHFTPRGLHDLAGRHGLAVTSLSYVSPEHDPYGWIQSSLNRYAGNDGRLTRLLMRLDSPKSSDAVTLVLAALGAAPAVLLAVVSWLAGSGALVQATLSRRGGV